MTERIARSALGQCGHVVQPLMRAKLFYTLSPICLVLSRAALCIQIHSVPSKQADLLKVVDEVFGEGVYMHVSNDCYRLCIKV